MDFASSLCASCQIKFYRQSSRSRVFSTSVYIQCLLSDISFYLSQSLIVVLSQVLPYDQLMQELDVMNVRELEDFLINECMYAVGIPHSKSILLLQS